MASRLNPFYLLLLLASHASKINNVRRPEFVTYPIPLPIQTHPSSVPLVHGSTVPACFITLVMHLVHVRNAMGQCLGLAGGDDAKATGRYEIHCNENVTLYSLKVLCVKFLKVVHGVCNIVYLKV